MIGVPWKSQSGEARHGQDQDALYTFIKYLMK